MLPYMIACLAAGMILILLELVLPGGVIGVLGGLFSLAGLVLAGCTAPRPRRSA